MEDVGFQAGQIRSAYSNQCTPADLAAPHASQDYAMSMSASNQIKVPSYLTDVASSYHGTDGVLEAISRAHIEEMIVPSLAR